LFLLPGLVIAWYVTETPIPDSHRIEITNYLFARQTEEGGWGLHIEGKASVFGTAMNYTTLRILGASAEDPRLVKARGLLHKFGGAVYGPHWTKFWLCVLGVCKWEILNPTPPELWCVLSPMTRILLIIQGFFRIGRQLHRGDGGYTCDKFSCQ
jgi:lanosterol synthase